MKYDTIIILGKKINDDGSLPKTLKQRVGKGIELYKKGFSDNLIMTGKWAFFREKEPATRQAVSMKKYAVSCGVPPKNIYLEEKSMDTIGNAYFTKIKYLEPKNWRNIILVTSDFHMRRTRLIFDFVLGKNFKIKYLKVPAKLSFFERWNRFKLEFILTQITKRLVDLNKAGNDNYIKNFLFTRHPAYAENSPYKKQFLKILKLF